MITFGIWIGEVDIDGLLLRVGLGLRVEARAGHNDKVIDDRSGVHGQIVDAHRTQYASSVKDGFPLQKATGRGGDCAIFQRLPVGPSAHRLLDVAGAGEDFVAGGARLDFDAAEASVGARIEYVAGVFVRLPGAERVELAGVAGADIDVGSAFEGEAEALLGLKVRDVGVGAVVLDAEYAAAIAGEGEQAVGAGGEGVDDFIFAGPDFARAPGFPAGRKFRCRPARRCSGWLPEESRAAQR